MAKGTEIFHQDQKHGGQKHHREGLRLEHPQAEPAGLHGDPDTGLYHQSQFPGWYLSCCYPSLWNYFNVRQAQFSTGYQPQDLEEPQQPEIQLHPGGSHVEKQETEMSGMVVIKVIIIIRVGSAPGQMIS